MVFLFSLTVTKMYGPEASFMDLMSQLVQCGWFCSASKNNNKSRSAYTIYFKIGLRALVHQNIRFGADPRIAFLPSSYMYRYKHNSVFRTHPKYANVEIYMQLCLNFIIIYNYNKKNITKFSDFKILIQLIGIKNKNNQLNIVTLVISIVFSSF